LNDHPAFCQFKRNTGRLEAIDYETGSLRIDRDENGATKAIGRISQITSPGREIEYEYGPDGAAQSLTLKEDNDVTRFECLEGRVCRITQYDDHKAATVSGRRSTDWNRGI
jgi:hypothetical protein